MKKLLKTFIVLFAFLFLFSCNNSDIEQTTESYNSNQCQSNALSIDYIRNKKDILEIDYSQSMLNRFQAEELLPESKKGKNKKTEDVTMLSVYNNTSTQIFTYGDGASNNSLNADYIFFVQNSNLSFIFDFDAFGQDEFIIHSLYAADLNNDGKYEIYLNTETNEGMNIIVGINLENKYLITAPFSGNSYMHYYENRLFWIRRPKDNKGSEISCFSPVLENNELIADPTISKDLFFAAINDWQDSGN